MSLNDILAKKQEVSDDSDSAFDEFDDTLVKELNEADHPEVPRRPKRDTETNPLASDPVVPGRPLKKSAAPEMSGITNSESLGTHGSIPSIPKRPRPKQLQTPDTIAPQEVNSPTEVLINRANDELKELEQMSWRTETPRVPHRPTEVSTEQTKKGASDMDEEDQEVGDAKILETTPPVPSRPSRSQTKPDLSVAPCPTIPARPSKVSTPISGVSTQDLKPENDINGETVNKEEEEEEEETDKDKDGNSEQLETENRSSVQDKDSSAEPVVPARPSKVSTPPSDVSIEESKKEVRTLESDSPENVKDEIVDETTEGDIETPIEAPAEVKEEVKELEIEPLQETTGGPFDEMAENSIEEPPIIPTRPTRVKTETSEATPIIPTRPSKLQPKDLSFPVVPSRPSRGPTPITRVSTDELKAEVTKLYGAGHVSKEPVSTSPLAGVDGKVQDSKLEQETTNDEPKADAKDVKNKGPPPVPKKPSSRIAAFQEMLRKNQELEKQQSQPERSSASRPSGDRSSAFKQNLNGLFALPGMTLPGMKKPESFSSDISEDAASPEVDGSDARKTRARGPRGKRLPKSASDKVEIVDKRVLIVEEVWGTGPGGVIFGSVKEEEKGIETDVVNVDTEADTKDVDSENGISTTEDEAATKKDETISSDAEDGSVLESAQVHSDIPVKTEDIGSVHEAKVEAVEQSEETGPSSPEVCESPLEASKKNDDSEPPKSEHPEQVESPNEGAFLE